MNTSPKITIRSPVFSEINAGSGGICAVTFAANSTHLLSGTTGIRLWRIEDAQEVTAMDVKPLWCLAVSKNGRWFAAGTVWDRVLVWDARDYKKVFEFKGSGCIRRVDFSPDSTRLVVASGDRATVWDIASGQQTLGPLHHEAYVTTARYSSKGDRIATATPDYLRIFDGSDGHLLADIPIRVTPLYNAGLVWFNNHLFILSNNKIMQVDSSNGLPVSDWSVPSTNNYSSIALPEHGRFIAYSTQCMVTFWDTSTHTQLGLIQHPCEIHSIAISPDDQFLAIGGEDGKIVVKTLSRITEPDIQIDDTVFHSWKHGQLTDAEASLIAATHTSENQSSHALACRALVRVHLQNRDAALDDAEQSIRIQPSLIGYIAKSISLVRQGKTRAAYRACDMAFEHCGSQHLGFLLLIKAMVVFMAGEHEDAILRMDDLIATARFDPVCFVVQTYMYLLLGDLHSENEEYSAAIQWFERANVPLQYNLGLHLITISLISGWKFDNLSIMVRQRLCEALYAAGRVKEAGESLLEMINTVNEDVCSTMIMEWVSDFTRRCLSSPRSNTPQEVLLHNRESTPREFIDSLTPTPILREWVKATLAWSSWKDALVAATSFVIPKFTIYRAVCEHLETTGRMMDTTHFFRHVIEDLSKQITLHDPQMEWILEKLVSLGDCAMSLNQLDDAISLYSTALLLNPASPQVLLKRSKASIANGSCAAALHDANEAIMFDPSSPWGYERKFAALYKSGDYGNAVDAFETMLSKMSLSPDIKIREQHRKYVTPMQIEAAIRRAIQDAIRDSPRVLINTKTGRLCDKSEQAATFEMLPAFHELISSMAMTTDVDHARIKHDVAEYYRYATFSHKWERNEPSFEKVVHIVVYNLQESPTHDKLRMFCKIVRDAGFNWAWSDTCCINKTDHFILQEALVAMFKWYENSSLTIVHLCGVSSPSRRGDLVKSIWNTRAWTFQEYHASKVVRFYTEDWKPYLNLDIPNHKESPEIMEEMEEATGISARALVALRPGLDDIREKLCLASRRETTLIEDAAYSLLGIFSISLPIVYGEGDKALGRLLGQLLASSGDTSILAWTGESGNFNTCLPGDISVFTRMQTTHVPSPAQDVETDAVATRLRSSTVNLALATKLYDRLCELPVPLLSGRRIKLPCLTFKLGPVSASRIDSEWAFRAQTATLGIVEIRTPEDLSRLNPLYLVHPWLDFLLDRQPVGGAVEAIQEEPDSPDVALMGELPSPGISNTSLTPTGMQSRALRLVARLGRSFSGQWQNAPYEDNASLRPPSSISQAEKEILTLRLIARLRQPFGALLLTPNAGGVAAYRRIATESLIKVQVAEITQTTLNKLAEGVRILDVL